MNKNVCDLRFVVDSIVKGRIYPALTSWQARPFTPSWRQFGDHWPWTTPLRVEEYCHQHGIPIQTCELPDLGDVPGFYPIGLGFFDFGIDYFALLRPDILQAVRRGRLKILFFYHEGDNPFNIKKRLDNLCKSNSVPTTGYKFVSSNSRAHEIKNFVNFVDFELWYYQRNLPHAATAIDCVPKNYDFVCLSRVHKSWRACIMADLLQNGILQKSIWSYCQTGDHGLMDNPIEVDSIVQLRYQTQKFLSQAPYFADNLSDAQRNDHSCHVSEFFTDAYANIVLESQFDVDQSNGCFLTEKTFKPIKHGQLFFIAGGPHSLKKLREMGYRTFDNYIDTSYDEEPDATKRWKKLRQSIHDAKLRGLHQLYQLALEDIQHNQRLFCDNKISRLNNLMEAINHDSQ